MSISGLMGVIASDFDGTTLRKDYSIQATEVIEEDVQEWRESSVNTKTQICYTLHSGLQRKGL